MSQLETNKKIAVLGAGIAGVTTAIGLKKLGFEVSIYYKKRAFTAYEGFSEKTKDGLKMIGCLNASKSLNTKSTRNSNWANISKSVNYEYVVCRDDLDNALIQDAKEYGVKLIEKSITGEIEELQDLLGVEFIVDARGRFTPFKNEYNYGPKSFSILQELEIPILGENKTSIDSIKDGWVWQAYVGKGKAYLQFSCDEKITKKIKSFDDVLKYLENQDLDLWTLKNYKTKNKIIKRDSYSKVHKTIVNEKMILVGDSASSIDPLSGNGAFQAMSMSIIAPYVVNTILNKQENKQVAIDFYKKRVNYIFDKFSKVGKDFYTMETRFKSKFWEERQSWPNMIKDDFKDVKIEQGAIVKKDFIEPKDVLITQDNPLGIYFLGDIEIVQLAKYCLENSKEKSIVYFNKYTENLDENFAKMLNLWLQRYKLL